MAAHSMKRRANLDGRYVTTPLVFLGLGFVMGLALANLFWILLFSSQYATNGATTVATAVTAALIVLMFSIVVLRYRKAASSSRNAPLK